MIEMKHHRNSSKIIYTKRFPEKEINALNKKVSFPFEKEFLSKSI